MSDTIVIGLVQTIAIIILGGYFVWQHATDRHPLISELEAKRSDRRQEIAAERRAERFMREQLTEAELDSLALNGYVEIASRLKPGSTYRVSRNPSDRLTQEWRAGQRVASYCVVVMPEAYGYGPLKQGARHGSIPTGDIVVAHVLLLKADERRYLLNANRFDHLADPDRPPPMEATQTIYDPPAIPPVGL